MIYSNGYIGNINLNHQMHQQKIGWDCSSSLSLLVTVESNLLIIRTCRAKKLAKKDQSTYKSEKN